MSSNIPRPSNNMGRLRFPFCRHFASGMPDPEMMFDDHLHELCRFATLKCFLFPPISTHPQRVLKPFRSPNPPGDPHPLSHLGHRGQGLCEELHFAESQAAVLGHHPDLETVKVRGLTSNGMFIGHPGSCWSEIVGNTNFSMGFYWGIQSEHI